VWALVATIGCGWLFLGRSPASTPASIPASNEVVQLASPLVIWVYGAEAQQLSRVLTEFQRSYPQQDVRIVPKSWGEFPGPLLAGLPAEDRPDLMQIGSTWVAALADSGLIESLDDRIRAGFVRREKMIPESWDLYRTDSGQFAIPWYLDVRALYYRSDLVPTPPATWDELRALAKRLRVDENGDGRKDRYVLSFYYGDVQNFIMTFWSSGGSFDRLDGPELALAFDRFLSLYRGEIAPYGLYEETRDPEAVFAMGYTPLMISGPWHIRAMESDYPWMSEAWTTAPLPRYEHAVSFVGGSGWAIPKGARNAEGAWSFIDYMSHASRQTAWWQIAGALPANREAWDTGILTGPVLAGFRESLKDIRHPPVDARWSGTEGRWGAIVRDAIAGKLGRAEALAALREAAAWIPQAGDKPDPTQEIE
jgi:multiple sugar transport system substrate-binding protein